MVAEKELQNQSGGCIMDLNEIYNEMKPLHDAIMEDQVKMKALEKDITVHLNELALKHYPEIQNLESEGFKKLADLIWHTADKYVIGISNIVFNDQIKE